MNIGITLIPLTQKEAVASMNEVTVYYLSSNKILKQLTEDTLKDSIFESSEYYLQKEGIIGTPIVSLVIGKNNFGILGQAEYSLMYSVGDIIAFGDQKGVVVNRGRYQVLSGSELIDLEHIVGNFEITLLMSHKELTNLELSKINKNLKIRIYN